MVTTGAAAGFGVFQLSAEPHRIPLANNTAPVAIEINVRVVPDFCSFIIALSLSFSKLKFSFNVIDTIISP